MQFVNNEPEQIEIRKSQNTLIVVGTGTILFSIWTAAKMLGLLFMLRKETVAALRTAFDQYAVLSDRAIFWTVAVVIIIFMALFLAVRAYVGLSAISEGRGRRHGRAYLLFAVIMIIVNISSFCTNLLTAEAPEQLGALTRDQSVSALIIEATSIIMMTQMVVSAIKIRKLTGTAKHAKGR